MIKVTQPLSPLHCPHTSEKERQELKRTQIFNRKIRYLMDFPSLQRILFKFFTQLFGNTDLVQSFLVKK